MIALIGAGFLGSIFAEELGKRLFAQEIKDATLLVIDSDTFEERNAANQNIPLDKAREGVKKAEWAANLFEQYGFTGETVVGRVEEDNILGWLPPDKVEVIVDAVDNIDTRQLLWAYGLKHKIPVMHIGISQEGSGAVEWTLDFSHDTFTLSPIQLLERPEPPSVPKRLRPCELIAHRATGFLIAHRGAVSLGHIFGLDPEEMFPDLVGRSFCSSWQVSANGVQHVINHNLPEVE